MFWTIIVVLYVILGLLTGASYGFGNPTDYANAKSVLVGFFWPLFWVGAFLYSFGYWVTRR